MKWTLALLCLVAVGASIGCDGESSSADKDAQFKEDVHTVADFIRANEERSDEMASQARVETTGKAIEALGQAVLIYQIKVGRLPLSLRDLTQPIGDGAPLVRENMLNEMPLSTRWTVRSTPSAPPVPTAR